MNEQIGKMLLGFGLMIAFIGVLVLASSKVPWLRLGRLPGDVSYQRGGFSVFFPITTMLLLSAVLSLVFFLIGRIRR